MFSPLVVPSSRGATILSNLVDDRQSQARAHPLLITKGILRSTMGTLHALVSLPLQLSTIAQRRRINLRSRRQAASNSGLCQDALFGTLVLGPGFSTRGNDCLLLNGLVRNGFLVGNGLLGIRGHGGWARNKVCDIRGNFGGNGGLGISLHRKVLCVFIPKFKALP